MKPRIWLFGILAFGMVACASILGVRKTPSHPFEHRAHVNRGINCLVCHTGIMEAESTDRLHIPGTADCMRCHAKPHDQRSCENCHGEFYVRAGAALARQHLKFEHRAHMPAVKGECVGCHSEVRRERADVLRPKMATCFSCHQHQNQWTLRDCDGCHVDLEGERTPPSSHLVHDGDFLREHGVRAASARDLCTTCHSEAQCAGCHGKTVAALPSKIFFDDVRLPGLHRAGFRSRHAEQAHADPGLCMTCHDDRSCSDCHALAGLVPGKAARSPHPVGWVSATRGRSLHGVQARIDPMSCAACHGGAGEQLCVDCHRVGGPGGNPHGHGFSSSKDKLRDVPCRLCHGGG